MYIDLVDTFLKTGSYPDKRGTPQVFCDDDFVQSFPWDAAAVDKHGNYIHNTLTGGYWTIRQIYTTFPDMVSMVPYFATSLNAYYFDAPNSASCHPGSLAETMVGIPAGHASISPVQWTSTIESEIMVICPAAVDGTHDFLERLGETGWVDPASYTMLDELIPESGTMYHELFHLVSGRIGWKRSLDPRKYVPRMVNDHAACECCLHYTPYCRRVFCSLAYSAQHCTDVSIWTETEPSTMQRATCFSLWLTGTTTTTGIMAGKGSLSTRGLRYIGTGWSGRCRAAYYDSQP